MTPVGGRFFVWERHNLGPAILRIRAWAWLAAETSSLAEKVRCLEEIVKLDPELEWARTALEDIRMSPTWYPARYVNVEVRSIPLAPQEESAARTEWHCLPLSRKQEEITTTCVNDDYFVDRAFPLFEYMRTITNKDLGSLLHRALAWHTTGNFLGSGLNRFLNYWESIELLAHFFYKRLPRELTARPTKSQKKDKVLDILNQPITRRNCLEIANQCARVVPPMPSARTVMQSTLPIITGQKDFGDVLFEKDPQTDTSLYDIRNDIAHGNRCDHDLEFTELVDARLHEVYSCSRDTLWLAVQRVSDLEKLLEA